MKKMLAGIQLVGKGEKKSFGQSTYVSTIVYYISIGCHVNVNYI